MIPPDRATGPKRAEKSLQDVLRRIREEHPVAGLPLPPEDAPRPPRPWADADDGEEG